MSKRVVIGGAILGLLGLKYGLPNIRYFAYMSYVMMRAKLSEGDISPSQETEFECMISMTDIDFWKHMNNAAYLRYAEAARHNGFLKIFTTETARSFLDNGYSLVLSAISVKYRRECKFRERFIWKTKPIYWDQCNVYLKQSMYHKQSGLLHCVLFSKLCLLKNRKFVKKLEKEVDGLYLLKWYKDKHENGNDYE